jgi:hypothetical protein
MRKMSRKECRARKVDEAWLWSWIEQVAPNERVWKNGVVVRITTQNQSRPKSFREELRVVWEAFERD